MLAPERRYLKATRFFPTNCLFYYRGLQEETFLFPDIDLEVTGISKLSILI